ncbi:hypothetical protein V7S43_004111 [Phytophthora oleae]|uniref:BZIP domain-containing protein n=1 Tax=Phytophthora oleae TaxID=2107226 RepID=A0ABD3FWY5_9STRA
MHQEEVNDAILADLAAFLGDNNALQLRAEVQAHAAITNQAPDLIQDSDQLLAETAALLASYSAPDSSTASSGPSDDAAQLHATAANLEPIRLKSPAELRRKMKNAEAAKRRLKYHNKIKFERQTT